MTQTKDKDKDISLAVKALKIGNKVRELRQRNRFTLQDLAARTGLSKPFLSQIENDHVVPPVATLLKLARALNVGMAYFFQDEVGDEKVSITRRGERIRVERPASSVPGGGELHLRSPGNQEDQPRTSNPSSSNFHLSRRRR